MKSYKSSQKLGLVTQNSVNIKWGITDAKCDRKCDVIWKNGHKDILCYETVLCTAQNCDKTKIDWLIERCTVLKASKVLDTKHNRPKSRKLRDWSLWNGVMKFSRILSAFVGHHRAWNTKGAVGGRPGSRCTTVDTRSQSLCTWPSWDRHDGRSGVGVWSWVMLLLRGHRNKIIW